MPWSEQDQTSFDALMNQGSMKGVPKGMRDRMRSNLNQQMQAQAGLQDFMGGRAYGPERILSLFEQNYQGPDIGTVQEQQVSAPSISGAMRYGYGAMDLAGRGAALQTGNAAQNLAGLNPLARSRALAEISRSAGSNLGAAGLQGYGQGIQALQTTDLANQSANLQAQGMNLESTLNQRAQALGLFGGSLDRAQQAALAQLQMIEQRRRDKQAQEAQEGDTLGNVLGAVGTILPLLSSRTPRTRGTAYEPPSYT